MTNLHGSSGSSSTGIVTVIVVILVLIGIGFNFCVDNRGATEDRAREGALRFITENNLKVKRVTCAGDSDGDGYGSCAITLEDGERIKLLCPTRWADKQMGATHCKEDFRDIEGLNIR